MADAWTIAQIAFYGLVLVVGLALLALARRHLAGLFLAGFVTLWGANGLYGQVGGLIGLSQGVILVPTSVAIWARMSLLVGFALMYPRLAPTGWRRRALFVLPLPFLAFVTALLARPELAASAAEGGEAFLVMVTLPSGVAYPLALLLLGVRWLSSPAGAYRTQVAWGLIPILFWNLHDGLGFHLYPLVYGGMPVGWLARSGFALASHAMGLAGLVIGLTLWVVALGRAFGGKARGDDRAVAFVTLFLLPVTLLQVLPTSYPAGTPVVHLLVDNVIVFLIAYGVARYRVIGLDLSLRWGVRSGTLAAAFIAVFFVASEVAAIVFEDLAGNAIVGVVAAGALLFALAPLQRAAESVAARAVPGTHDPEAYLTYRRFQIYSAALEGTLRDGNLDPRESASLRQLRQQLGLTDEDHARLERDLRARFATA